MPPNAATASRLEAIARAVRLFLEPVWPDWQIARGYDPSLGAKWTCGRSALFLQRVVREDFAIEARWISGTPRLAEDAPELGPYGFLCDGRWESHAWVEADGFILDVTADQFGAPPVVVTARPDSRYGEGTGDTASPDSLARRHQTVEALWPVWLASEMRRSVKGG